MTLCSLPMGIGVKKMELVGTFERLMLVLAMQYIVRRQYGQENEASIIGLVDNWTVCLYL